MKEFFYTACPTGKRADDRGSRIGGYGVRAWTAGTTRANTEPVMRWVACDPPPAHLTPPGGVRRFAFVRPREGRPVLLQTTYRGRDEMNRPVPFTHVLFDLPDEFGPADAIRAWGSPGWCEDYTGDELELPPPRPLPPGVLDDAGLTAFLADERNRAMTAYALAAVLGSRPAERVFLYAPPEDVAWVVYALARVVPLAHRRDLTFSTYERNVLDAPVRIVGTCGLPGANDLPARCYDRTSAAFNRDTGRCGMPLASDYAELAVRWLADDRGALVDELLRTAEADGATDEQLDDLAVLLHAPERLTTARLQRLRVDARTAARVRDTIGVERLVECFAAAGWAAFKEGNVAAGRYALETVLRDLGQPDGYLDHLNREQLDTFPPPAQRHLVSVLLDRAETGTIVAQLPHLAAEHIGELITDPRSPHTLRLAAVRDHHRRFGQPPPQLRQPTLPIDVVIESLGWLFSLPTLGPDQARDCLAAQARERDRERELTRKLPVLADADPALWPLADLHLAWLADTYPTYPDRVAELLGLPLVRSFGCSPAVTALAFALLEAPAETREKPPAREFLAAVRDTAERDLPGGRASPDLIAEIDFHTRLDGGAPEGEHVLAWFKSLLDRVHDPERRARLRDKTLGELADSLLRRPDADLGPWLDSVLTRLTHDAGFDTRGQAFAALLDRLQEPARVERFWGTPRVLAACLAVCLGVPAAARTNGVAHRRNGPFGPAAQVERALEDIYRWLCAGAFACRQEYAFFHLFRCIATWPQPAVEALAAGYERAKADATAAAATTPPPAKSGFFARHIWGRK